MNSNKVLINLCGNLKEKINEAEKDAKTKEGMACVIYAAVHRSLVEVNNALVEAINAEAEED